MTSLTSVAGDDPASTYRARAAERKASRIALERHERRISAWRLVVFAAAVLLGFLAWRDLLSAWYLVAPVAAFAWLVRRHETVIDAREHAARAEVFYARGLARIEDRWAGGGETGERFRNDEHLYANDLDLFGRGSLFELLSIARTRAGEETLSDWLKAPAARAEILARHDAINELTPALDLREALSLAGADIRTGVHTAELIAWAEAPPRLPPGSARWVPVGFTAVTLSTAVFWFLTGAFVPFVVALVAQSLFQQRFRSQIDTVLHGTSGPARDLTVLLRLVERIEHQSFRAERLARLHRSIADDEHSGRASVVIRRLERLSEAHDWEHNLVFTIVALLLMWGTHIAWAIEAWRGAHGRKIAAWLRAVGELEALSSLSAYRYEHPADPFPEILERADGPSSSGSFIGASLGHPLLPAARMVRNDVSLGADRQLLVVSGSNMSGKSTLLRTVGINAVLALAGAPVRASRLCLTPLALGATLRIQDSLQEGRSRFYAEITRIRAIVDRADGSVPLLFLLDELFHGTNSHDRLAGASGVLRSLLDRTAMGLITTHDLALTGIVDELRPRAENVHFEDRFEEGEIRFDYRMKPGPVTRSNALALMRAVGLVVPGEPDAGPVP